MRTGIVLAGGRSSRFGGDKLAADLDGTSLLEATIAAVVAVTDGVIVAGPGLPAGFRAGETPVALIRDAEPFAGPLAALSNVLRSAVADPTHLAIVVGGDMPGLVPAVLEAMLGRLDRDQSIDAIVLAAPADEASGGSHPRQVLPLALRVERARSAARASLASGHRSLQRLLDALAWIELPASEWLALDPEASTLLDVDTEAELDRLRARNPR